MIEFGKSGMICQFLNINKYQSVFAVIMFEICYLQSIR